MNRLLKDKLVEIFWNSKLLPSKLKDKAYRIYSRLRSNTKRNVDNDNLLEFFDNIYKNEKLDNSFSKDYPKIENSIDNLKGDPKLLAYYLPQFCPDTHNDAWWGKGVTEWTNVGKAMPQYIGHYQPRCPGELGYYDLRLKDNIYRQIELAKIYGVYGFCFYYYWFDGERLLDKVFDSFVQDDKIDFPFAICWANEDWTQQWNGISAEPLIKQSKTVESYQKFIESCYYLFTKPNYIRINNRPLLIIYRPNNMPTNRKEIIDYWQDYVYRKLGCKLYVISIYRDGMDLIHDGFDKLAEFAPITPFLSDDISEITKTKKYLHDRFCGRVYDYKDYVVNKKYFKRNNVDVYRALCPMWDNTARRHDAALVFDGATPDLYKQWLKDIIIETKQRVEKKELDDNLIFINAWNEWAEGAYLEPDLYWKYGYLEATRDAILETRGIK